MNAQTETNWIPLCQEQDLIPHSGVAALLEEQAIALFYLPEQEQPLYAVSNLDPISGANVMARGLVGDVEGKPMVASPLYKQHFLLDDGQCLEMEEHQLQTWPVRLHEGRVEVMV